MKKKQSQYCSTLLSDGKFTCLGTMWTFASRIWKNTTALGGAM